MFYSYSSLRATFMYRSVRKLSGHVLSAHSGKTLLPGFGRPLNYTPEKEDPDFVGDLFPNALSGRHMRNGVTTLRLTTLRELTMLQLMNSITDKPDWNIKINNPEIAQKWKEEALNSGRDITDKMINWCISELKYKASLIPPPPDLPPPIVVYKGAIVKSDFAISAEFKKELQNVVRRFEEKLSENMKDWHPNSGEKVWDLVHPSLYPLVYGRTRVLASGETTTLEDCIQRCGQGEVAPVPPESEIIENLKPNELYGWQPRSLNEPFSSRFQWLPCDVDISEDEARITSYINNLHPQKEKPLYRLVEKLISSSIPLWNISLAHFRDDTFRHTKRINYNYAKYDPPEPDRHAADYYEKLDEWQELPMKVIRPEPPDSFTPLREPRKYSLKKEYRERGLQVIVKLANIELTPEKPEYDGGSWHIEGQMNEHIVATALYYHDSQNVTTSTLSFRHHCSFHEAMAEDVDYVQDMHEFLPEVFGGEQNEPAVQEMGGVETREGRLLTFPNILQHRVGPFKLQDPTKPGHRKIVALFLVDPNIKVISTANVPCQRQDWWLEFKKAKEGEIDSDEPPTGSISDSPTALQKDFPITLEEARVFRLELMEERKVFVYRQTLAFEQNAFSLCEH